MWYILFQDKRTIKDRKKIENKTLNVNNELKK